MFLFHLQGSAAVDCNVCFGLTPVNRFYSLHICLNKLISVDRFSIQQALHEQIVPLQNVGFQSSLTGLLLLKAQSTPKCFS